MTTTLRATALLLACAAARAGCMDSDPGPDLGSAEETVETKTPNALGAYRVTKVNVRDPHLFAGSGRLCTDLTSQLDAAINLAVDVAGPEGVLLQSPTVVFRPLSPRARTSPFELHFARCTAPAARATCGPGRLPPSVATAVNASSGTCLGVLPGTVRPYSPRVQGPSGSCFATEERDLLIRIVGGAVRLRHAQIGGTYLGANAHKIKDGLLRGFLVESEADQIVLPAGVPMVGGKRLSELLGGGRGSCGPRTDKDVVDGVTGWWVYINFDATSVPWRE